MEYGKIKVGDTVIFTDEAKVEIGTAVDSREHIILTVIGGTEWEHVSFEDGDGADVYWLYRVREAKV